MANCSKAGQGGTLEYNVPFNNGLTVTIAAGGDFTVIYE
jgi:hypothetical protein